MHRLKPSHLTVYMLIAFLLVAILGIIAMRESTELTLLENRQLAEEVAVLEQENLEYLDLIAALGTDESVEHLARERLHWVYDQEIVYIDSGSH